MILSLDFEPIDPVTESELSEFTAAQTAQLITVLNRIGADPVNNFRENSELRGTLNYLAQKVGE